ncbi:MAG TPA: MotA/TolQ/ExbB proton channel family protein [Candidatus Limnocylindria bacterium]|jgi:biopolymer transport protein ExbB|nr:MotA/TolQ/ExbB proton channel family protein [Candidatus Limnocylindria bacterium]
MWIHSLLAAAETSAPVALPAIPPSAESASYGLMFWVLVLVSAGVLAVIVERALYYHRVQIDSAQFLAGVRNVLRRDNVIEAISICNATPGPVSLIVKNAILSKDGGPERVKEAIEDVAMVEVPRLEANLGVLATLAQIAPLLGLLGTLFGFMKAFQRLQGGSGFAAPAELFAGVWQALYAAALGIAIAAVCYGAYNYLVSRVNAIVLDMERASAEAARLVAGLENGVNGNGNGGAGSETPSAKN